MPVVVTVEVRGLDAALARLDAAPALMEAAVSDAIRQETLLAEAEIKARTPRVTGRLQSSIGSTFEVGPLGTVGRISTNVVYASFIETGQRRLGRGKDPSKIVYRRAGGAHMFTEGLRSTLPNLKRIVTLAIQGAIARLGV